MAIFLTDNWTVRNNGFGEFPARVPGDITADLYACGKICDPLYSDNLKTLSHIFEEDYEYVCTFDIDDKTFADRRVFLHFDGIDTFSRVTLNGKVLGATDNMFSAYRFDVKDIVKRKGNVLSVQIFSAVEYGKKRPNNEYYACFSSNRVYMRKAQCHFGWDWAPNLPGMGIWLPVYITSDDGVSIDNVHIVTNNDGDVSCLITLENGCARWDREQTDYKLEVTVGGQTTEYPVSAIKNLVNFSIENPKLWWPNGYGEQALYDYEVKLYNKGERVDGKSGKFGFKEVRLIEKPVGTDCLSFTLAVNGRPIFCKGSNWVPISNMTGAIEDSAYVKLVSYAKECNYNLLRVWGGGIYEKDIFYDLCDRAGILVWQDFGFACSAIPDDVKDVTDNFLREAEYQIKRIRNHASLAVLCGGNEFERFSDKIYSDFLVQNTLRGMCNRLASGIVYLHNSPSGIHDNEWITKSGDSHVSSLDRSISADDVGDFRKFIPDNLNSFVSESILLGPCRMRSLRKFIPKDKIDTVNDIWEFHFVKNPYSYEKRSFVMKEQKIAEDLFGAIEPIEEFVKKAMIAHAEYMTAEIDYARAHKDRCSGFLNWMYNDNWGCGTWSVVDYESEKKPAFYAQKRCFAPVRVCFTQESDGFALHVVNDTYDCIEDTLVFGQRTLDGSTVFEEKVDISVQANGLWHTEISPRKAENTYLFAYRKSDTSRKTIFFHEYWRGKKFRTDIKYAVKTLSDCEAEIEITANSFARTVFVDYSDGGATVSDNYFDMEKGDVRTVKISSDISIDIDSIALYTFCDKWEN